MTLASKVGNQLRRIQRRVGTTVAFRGIAYQVVTEQTAGAKVGTQNLSHLTLGAFAASEDPRIFLFNAQDFQPYTTVVPPQEGELITYHGLLYLVTVVSYEDVGERTTEILVGAYRKVL